jgi:hypothetical protein
MFEEGVSVENGGCRWRGFFVDHSSTFVEAQ